MSWKKHVQIVNRTSKLQTAFDKSRSDSLAPGGINSKFSSFLPEIYAGHPQRIQRYDQYDQMDMDSEVNAALDTIADFSTQLGDRTDSPFRIFYKKEANSTETELIKTSLEQWTNLNQLKKRMWRIFRNAIKYGDQIFIRDPETLELYHIEPANVEKVIANESEGKDPQLYLIRDLDLNHQKLTATEPEKYGANIQGMGTNTLNRYSNKLYGSQAGMGMGYTGYNSGSWGSTGNDIFPVEAKHIVHITMSEGLDANWPFGTSILEPIFKVYKQKELLEDAIIIYRIHRAPERRIFYIDVGSMPPHRANAYIERIKNEIQQRRIPNRTGGGACFTLDTRIPLIDGRTLSLADLIKEYEDGKENWAYSCNPETGIFAPGLISWAGITRENTQIVKLTLDNGEIIKCTPDHKFPVIGKGKVEAQNIIINEDSLISFNTKTKKIIKKTKILNKYQQLYNYFKKKILKNKENHSSDYHTVISIEFINQLHTTGTITIDGDELYHNFHTFALEQGVYTFNSIMDASYSPMSMLEDYFFASSTDGRGSKVETLPGGENTGDITDLKYFDNKLKRGLRVPSSYLPTGPDDGVQPWNDGRVGTAYIQEFRFATYCERLQLLISEVLDKEFKLYMKRKGILIDNSLFDLKLNKPENFAMFAEIERKNAQVQLFGNIAEAKFLSKRFALKEYLGLDEDKINENFTLWKEENQKLIKNKSPAGSGSIGGGGMGGGSPGLDSVGIRPDAGGAPEPEMPEGGAELNLGGESPAGLSTEASADEGGGADEG